MPKVGDRVKIETRERAYEGILLPEEKSFAVIKLDSGYNIGIDKKRIKNIHLLERKKERAPEKPREFRKKELPTISILHTGGTIASKVDYETGGVVARFTPEELQEMFPELKKIANLRSRLVRNMFSEDIRFAHYNVLAQEIEKEIERGAHGVIVTHGTDTMHYTAAALSFMLKDLPVPVILVGAQRSSDRGSSDASLNLVSAAFFIVSSKDFAEVAICMHENKNDDWCVILPGTKTRKMHSSQRDAFQAINTTPWARVNIKQKKTDFYRTNYNKRSNKKIKHRPFKENLKIALVKTHPGMRAKQVEFYNGYDGLVLEGFGLGHLPINEIDEFTKEHTKIANAIKKLVKNGTIIAVTTQTISGIIDLNVYSTGRKMQELGIIGNYLDMTPETAFVKLAWLLSNHDKKDVPKLYQQNLVGEISERLEKT